MNYQPITGVWEITMGCNMRCGHCGSSCENPLPDELTTEEAFKVCDSMGKLGMSWVTLSGGEPLTRKDWPLLAERLRKNGVIPNIITNGWLMTEEIIKTAKEKGVGTFAISLDGLKNTHDRIRKEGSYDRTMEAFRMMNRLGQTSGAITTVMNENIDQLDELKEVLINNGVNSWQLQIGLPMGNLSKMKEAVIKPEIVDRILDFVHKTSLEGKIIVFPADCIGYYTEKEAIVRQISSNHFSPVTWKGCNAGKRSFGLLHNGDVLGCTSIRDKSFIEGNVKNSSLEEIWTKKDSFKWARDFKKSELKGNCNSCTYGDVCLGGCPNTRLTMNGSIYSDNPYCSFNSAIEATKETLIKYNNSKELLEIARSYAENKKYQLSFLTLNRALEIEPQNVALLELYGFVNFFMGNYEMAKDANEAILKEQPENVYALKGMGLSLHKMGNSDDGLNHLLKAVELTPPEFMEPFYDLSLTYYELGRKKEAIEILEKGERKSPGFILRTMPLYNMLNT